MRLWPFKQRERREAIGDYYEWHASRVEGDDPPVQVTENTALRHASVYAAIQVLSQSLAVLPLRLVRTTPDGGTEPATGHPLSRIGESGPNDETTAYKWLLSAEAHRAGWGNAYAKVIRRGGRVAGLEPWEPQNVAPRKHADGSILYDHNPPDGPSETLSALDVVHVWWASHDGWRGLSPIRIGRETIGLGLRQQQFAASFYRNGLAPKGWLETDAPPNAMKRWLDEFADNFTGALNSHKTPILPRGMKLHTRQISPEDAQALESSKFNRSLIASLFRVPSSFLMDFERATFNNSTEQNRHFAQHTLRPNARMWTAELGAKLLSDAERAAGYRFVFDMDELQRGDMATRYESYGKGIQSGWLTRNEAREREGLPRIDGLDDPLTPSNMMDGASGGSPPGPRAHPPSKPGGIDTSRPSWTKNVPRDSAGDGTKLVRSDADAAPGEYVELPEEEMWTTWTDPISGRLCRIRKQPGKRYLGQPPWF